jgi:uncharacterized protein (TIGR03067 family)
MTTRLGLALLLLIGPLAFAPAPLPRRDRGGQGGAITLASFQGRWRLVKRVTTRADGQHVPTSSPVTHVVITGDRWQFMANDSQVNAFYLSIDPSRTPAHLNFYDQKGGKQLSGVALIRRHGPGVQVLYNWGDESKRPRNFDPPTEGCWLAYLEK